MSRWNPKPSRHDHLSVMYSGTWYDLFGWLCFAALRLGYTPPAEGPAPQ